MKRRIIQIRVHIVDKSFVTFHQRHLFLTLICRVNNFKKKRLAFEYSIKSKFIFYFSFWFLTKLN